MTKRRLAACFTPDAIAGQVAERKRVQDELEDIFLKLKRFDSPWILKNNLGINEDQALLLLSSQMSFYGVVNLKLALDHVLILTLQQREEQVRQFVFCSSRT